MSKQKIRMRVLKEEQGYSASAHIGKHFVGTQGNSLNELQSNVLEAINLLYEDKGLVFGTADLVFEFDLASFFSFYKVINAKALSERIGMNQSLLAQYIKGAKKPSPLQTRRIMKGVQQIGKELSAIELMA